MSFVDDTELTGHIESSLIHLQFARDFMWRTGMKEELIEEGWLYGADWNGTGELEASQFHIVVKLLMPELTVDVEQLVIGESEEWEEIEVNFDRNRPPFSDEFVWVAEFRGKQEELQAWASFLNMFLPGGHIGYWTQEHWTESEPQTHFLWLVPQEEFLYMEAFTAMVSAWEVKTYYDHLANQRAWRELRGSTDADSTFRSVTTIGDCPKRCETLQNSVLDATA